MNSDEARPGDVEPATISDEARPGDVPQMSDKEKALRERLGMPLVMKRDLKVQQTAMRVFLVLHRLLTKKYLQFHLLPTRLKTLTPLLSSIRTQ